MKSVFLLLIFIVSSQCLYDSTSKVVKLTNSNFHKLVVQSKQPWFVEFYAPWCGHCKNLAPEWEKLAKALEGIIQVGAVDMTTDQQAGAAYNIQGFPTIKFFGENKASPIDYQQSRSANDMINFAFNQAKNIAMARLKPNYKQSQNSQQKDKRPPVTDKDVIILTDSNFDEQVMQSKDAWFIEFYAPWCGHCQKLEPEWNELAQNLKDQVKVAKLDATVEKQIAQRFGIQGFPTLKFFPPGEKIESLIESYEGSRDANSMGNWALEKKNLMQPAQFEQLIDQSLFDQYCIQSKGACLIAFLPHIYDSSKEERESYLEIMKKMADRNKGKPISFLWAQGGDYYELEEKLALGSGYPTLIAISFKKQVYSTMRASFTEQSVSRFITGLLSGKEHFNKMYELPKLKSVQKWDGNDKQPEKDTDEDIHDEI